MDPMQKANTVLVDLKKKLNKSESLIMTELHILVQFEKHKKLLESQIEPKLSPNDYIG